jgi:hypothetical protein
MRQPGRILAHAGGGLEPRGQDVRGQLAGVPWQLVLGPRGPRGRRPELGGRAARAQPRSMVQRAVVADRQVLQLERADAVLGRERRLDALHRQLVGRIGHVLGASVSSSV